MLHGRHDRKSNAVADNATAAILCDQDEFGKTIGKQETIEVTGGGRSVL